MEEVPSSFCSSSTRNLMIVLSIFLSLLQLIPAARSATQQDYFCEDEDLFVSGSSYEANLHVLLNYLIINTKANPGRDDVVRAVGKPPERVYGEAICLSYETFDCAVCLNKAKSDLLHVCNNKKGGQVSAVRDCYLSYASINMFNINDSTIVAAAAATTTSPAPIQLPTTILSPPPPVPLPPPPFSSFKSHAPSSPSQVLNQQALTALSPPPPSPGEEREGKGLALLITLPVVSALLFSSFLLFFMFRRRRTTNNQDQEQQQQSGNSEYHYSNASRNLQEIVNVDLEDGCTEAFPFQLKTLAKATNNFSHDNLVGGDGSIGPLYKGILDDGQAIAVKRVVLKSKSDGEQLENEIVLVSKLDHKNLVKILGFCFEEDDPLLVYEYLPNTSLDKILHDPKKSKQLDWPRRYKIINGIAQGLLYIHEYPMAKIVHRNLKTSNVLLDTDMNPRISDFGIARHSERDQVAAGKLAHMAPEYHLYGEYLMKSDVYSFGVLILEIITGMKKPSSSEELIDHVSKNLMGGTIREVLDPVILKGSYVEEEVLRCINAALLCVRDEPSDRPEMSLLIVMLANQWG